MKCDEQVDGLGFAEFCGRRLSAKSENGITAREYLTCQHVVDLVECLVNLGPNLGTGQDDLARDEDQENHFRLDHSVDKTREQLQRLVSF
jgi:hypothetical protein